jgi:hypothetical protein
MRGDPRKEPQLLDGRVKPGHDNARQRRDAAPSAYL